MSPHLESLYRQIQALSREEREELIIYARSIDKSDDLNTDVEPWDETELARLLHHEPQSTKTLIEDGLVGAWVNQPGIQDGVEWADEQRRKRLEKFKW